MKTTMMSLVIGVVTLAVCSAKAAETDKTLVSWVTLANTAQRGGSALTIQNGPQFDAIVFGEIQPGKWMAGSHLFARTQNANDQNKNAPETAISKTLVQMAVVYQGDQITIYRNGEVYASYSAKSIDLLSPKHNIAVFGLRHIGTGGDHFAGSIEDARIYSKALSANEIKSLTPNQKSTIKPYAWWDFEGDKVKDYAGRFAHSKMDGGAKLADGKLILSGSSILVAATTEEDVKVATRRGGGRAPTGPYIPETPTMPKELPANWMTYHLVHPGPGVAMPGDPNPAFYYKGRYHMHYIYRNHTGYVFAHVSSKDMVHWKWHPTVLAPPTTGHGMFSGTGFFTKEGKAAMIYHGAGSGRNWLAYALDDTMDKWTQPEAVLPKTKDGQDAQIRHWDPDCWLNGDTYYALSGGKNPQLMKSSDLKNWEYLGAVLHDDFPTDLGVPKGEDISCANMFKIGNKWMLLCISHPLGCRYYLGDFKDEKYLPEFHSMMSWNGNNFFAPESIISKDGRRVMWAWLLRMPIAPTGVQSLPRELELPKDGVLRMKPLHELEALRYDEKQETQVTVNSDASYPLGQINSDAVELKLEFASPAAKEFGLDVLCDQDGQGGMRVAVIPESKILRVGHVNAPFELKAGEDLTLRVFIDKNLVEVFANDRQAAAAALKNSPLENTAAKLFAVGADVKVKTMTAWKMKSIYTGR